MLKLFDTHAHLDEIQDISGALARARTAGLRKIVAVGSDLGSNERILEIARSFPEIVLPAIGLHPWRLEGADIGANLEFIERELPHCVALGEVGLDWAIQVPRAKQEEVLGKLLVIASREKKPVLLHARRAWPDAFRLLKSFHVERAVFHWYSGPLEALEEILSHGYFISATPAAAYSERHRQGIRRAPLARLLLETDCPEKYRGKESEPKDLWTAVQAAGELKGMKPEEIAAETFSNAVAFFDLPPEPEGV